MKERPILFSGEMVRAILQGRKTQTRRVVKASRRAPWRRTEPMYFARNWTMYPHPGGGFMAVDSPDLDASRVPIIDRAGFPCPYGVVGDRLWVRETWGYRGSSYTIGEAIETQSIEYADGERRSIERPHGNRDGIPVQPPPPAPTGDDFWDEESRNEQLRKWWASWRPSIYMPRWASRLTLEVTDVRVERLQDITEDDARAEGIAEGIDLMVALKNSLHGTNEPTHTRRAVYAKLWDSLNAKRGYSWDSNPWAWVISFKRIEHPTP